MLWCKDTGTGGVFLKQNFTNVAEDANANAVRDGVKRSDRNIKQQPTSKSRLHSETEHYHWKQTNHFNASAFADIRILS